MRDEKKWVKELSDFFVKDENWNIACDTVGAVKQVESYWENLFWQNVYQHSRDLLDEGLWEVRKEENDGVYFHPKKDKYKVEENCGIQLSCDEEDWCWYAIWIEEDAYKRSQKITFVEFFKEKGLQRGDSDYFYKPKVAPYLDRAQLGKEALNNFEGAKFLVSETVKFIEQTDVRNILLTLK